MGDICRVQLLVEEGASLGAGSWLSPLHIAAGHGHLRVSKWLLNAKADLEQLDYRGMTPVEVAVKAGHEKIVDWVLDVHKTSRSKLQISDGFLIHRAVQSEQVHIVQCLIRAGVAGANDPNDDGRTALYLSCKHGLLELCKWLYVEAGADSNTTDTDNWGCLHVAAHYGQLGVVGWLLDINPDLLHATANGPMIENATKVYLGDFTALHLAARKNHLAIFKLLKVHCEKQGTNLNDLVDMKDTEGCTALHRAIDNASGPYPELAQWLIAHGKATLVKDDARGFTPLHFACRKGHRGFIEWLFFSQSSESTDPQLQQVLDYRGGLDVNAKDNLDRQPLHTAIRNISSNSSHAAIARYLVTHAGADLLGKDINKLTCVHTAIKVGHAGLAMFFIDQASKVQSSLKFLLEAPCSEGETALHMAVTAAAEVAAAECGQTRKVSKLGYIGSADSDNGPPDTMIDLLDQLVTKHAELGLSLDTTNKREMPPLFVAINNGCLEVAELLIQAGADIGGELHHRSKGDTAFHRASSGGMLPLLERMVEQVRPEFCQMTEQQELNQVNTRPEFCPVLMNLQRQDNNGTTPLHCAAAGGRLETVQWLIEQGADIEAVDKQGCVPFAFCKNVAVAEVLLDASPAVINHQSGADSQILSRNGLAYPVHMFIERGEDEEVVEALVHLVVERSSVKQLASQNSLQQTSLHLAISKSFFRLAKWIVERLTALVTVDGAVQDTGLARTLVVKDKDGHEPVHLAAKSGDIEFIEWFIRKRQNAINIGCFSTDVNLKSKNNDGLTVLHIAADCPSLELARWLVTNKPGLSVEIQDHVGETVGHRIVSRCVWSEAAQTLATHIWERLRELKLHELIDKKGRTIRTIAEGHGGQWLKWSLTLDTFLGRYRRANFHTVSDTSIVWKATDVKDCDRRVALKVVKSSSQISKELCMRQGLEQNRYVLQVLHVHVPAAHREEYKRKQELMSAKGGTWQLANEPTNGVNEFVLVLPWADSTLNDELRSKPIAGIDYTKIRDVMWSIGRALRHLHVVGKRIHGDVSPRNIVKTVGSKDWMLIHMEEAQTIDSVNSTTSLEASTLTGSEAYRAPEIMEAQKRKAEIKIAASLDVWSYGVLLYELCCGVDLFQKDLSKDKMVRETDREKLLMWRELTSEQLDLVFEHALQNENETKQITRTRQLVTQDLIALCLRGISAYGGDPPQPAPSDRPSMDEILEHPFFIANDNDLDNVIQLPDKLMPHQGEIDVMFSYQSNNVLEMTRLIRYLRYVGIRCKSGLMVGGGDKWRKVYFENLDKATVFSPILAPSYYTSIACYDESKYVMSKGAKLQRSPGQRQAFNRSVSLADVSLASCEPPVTYRTTSLELLGSCAESAPLQEPYHQVGKSKWPVCAVMANGKGWKLALDSRTIKDSSAERELTLGWERTEFYRAFVDTFSCTVPQFYGQNFKDEFWLNAKLFSKEIERQLRGAGKYKGVDSGVIVCAPEDVDFAKQIQNVLKRQNITTHVCSKLSDWNEHEKECSTAPVLLPVISRHLTGLEARESYISVGATVEVFFEGKWYSGEALAEVDDGVWEVQRDPVISRHLTGFEARESYISVGARVEAFSEGKWYSGEALAEVDDGAWEVQCDKITTSVNHIFTTSVIQLLHKAHILRKHVLPILHDGAGRGVPNWDNPVAEHAFLRSMLMRGNRVPVLENFFTRDGKVHDSHAHVTALKSGILRKVEEGEWTPLDGEKTFQSKLPNPEKMLPSSGEDSSRRSKPATFEFFSKKDKEKSGPRSSSSSLSSMPRQTSQLDLLYPHQRYCNGTCEGQCNPSASQQLADESSAYEELTPPHSPEESSGRSTILQTPEQYMQQSEASYHARQQKKMHKKKVVAKATSKKQKERAEQHADELCRALLLASRESSTEIFPSPRKREMLGRQTSHSSTEGDDSTEIYSNARKPNIGVKQDLFVGMNSGYRSRSSSRSFSRSFSRTESLGDIPHGAYGEELEEKNRTLMLYATEDEASARQMEASLSFKVEVVRQRCDNIDWYVQCDELKDTADSCLILHSANFEDSYDCQCCFEFAAETLKKEQIVVVRVGDARGVQACLDQVKVDLEELQNASLQKQDAQLLRKMVIASNGMEQAGNAEMLDVMSAAIQCLNRNKVKQTGP